MSEPQAPPVERGARAVDRDGRRVGTVDAVFVDYLLVRTAGLLPVDLYVPTPDYEVRDGSVVLAASASEARERWRRPLRAAPHEPG